MSVWIAAVCSVFLAAACWTDLRRMVIPNVLTGGFAAAGIAIHAAAGGWQGVLAALEGGAAGTLPLLVLYRMRGMGAGDVKWFGAFGVLAGAVPALRLMMCAVLVAGCLSLLLLIIRIRFFRRWTGKIPWPWGDNPAITGGRAVFPFMLAVAPAFVWCCCSEAYRLEW